MWLTIVEFELPWTASQLARVFGPRPGALEDYELVSESTIRVDGRTAVRIEYTWTAVDQRLRDVPVTAIQVYTMIDDKAVFFVSTMRSEGADKFVPVVDDIVASFDFQ